jgi:Ca2+-binding EF-hand superfamily protein
MTQVGVLAVLVVYMVACLTTTLIGDDETLDVAGALLAAEYFGTVERSMLTLLQIMTTDGWCSECARAFMETNNITTIIVIVVWVIASALILMNLLAAIFVDKLMQLTDEEKVKKQETQEKKKRELMEKLKEIFLEFDEDGNGVLTEAELKEAMKAFDINADGVLEANEITMKFQQAGLKKEDVNDLISYLSSMGNDGVGDDVEIDYESFINGIFSIYDPCTRKDALEILSTVKNIHRSVIDVHRGGEDGNARPTDGSSEWAKSVDSRVDQLQRQVRP